MTFKNFIVWWWTCLCSLFSLVHIFFACIALRPEVYMKWFGRTSWHRINFFPIPASCTCVQIISYALPVATQHKQKDVNQALANGVCVHVYVYSCVCTFTSMLHLHISFMPQWTCILCCRQMVVVMCNCLHVVLFCWFFYDSWKAKCNIMQYYFVANKLDKGIFGF